MIRYDYNLTKIKGSNMTYFTTKSRHKLLLHAIIVAILTFITSLIIGLSGFFNSTQVTQPVQKAENTATTINKEKISKKPKLSPTAYHAPSSTVVVRGGESIWSISQQHHVGYQHLLDINQLTNANLIYQGQKIKLN